MPKKCQLQEKKHHGELLGSSYAISGGMMRFIFTIRSLGNGLFSARWLAGILTLLALPALADLTVPLAWDPDVDPSIAGYKIYFGVASRVYTNSVDVGNVTNTTIVGLATNTTYYFAATSYDTFGDESDFSAEVTNTPASLPPTLNALGNLAINENAGLQTVNLTGISLGTGQTLVIKAASSNPALIPNPTVYYTSPAGQGALTFTPAANASGTATITVTANNGLAQTNVTTQTFTVTVAPVYQAPTLAPLNNIAINGNVSPQTVKPSGSNSVAPPALQTVNLTGISLGSGSSLTITASSSNPALIPNPVVNYISPSATGSLTFTPVQNVGGSTTITVTANNGQPQNNLTTQTFVVTVTPPALLPTLNPIANVNLEYDAAAQVIALSGIGPGVNGAGHKIQITAVSSNPRVVPNPRVSYVNPQTVGTLTLTPASQISGMAVITVKVNDGGISNNIFAQTFTVTVLPNQKPTLDPIANVTLLYNSAAQRINLSRIGPGANGEIQKLTVTAVSNNPKLIPNPKVGYINPQTNGSVTLKPAVNASGTAVITVTVNDGGKTNNLFSQTFTVTVSPQAVSPNILAVAPATLTSTMRADGKFSLTVNSGSGNQSVVEASTDLINWTPVYTNTASFTFVDDQTGQFAKRFYRAVSVP